jgi:hypothetical protein
VFFIGVEAAIGAGLWQNTVYINSIFNISRLATEMDQKYG